MKDAQQKERPSQPAITAQCADYYLANSGTPTWPLTPQMNSYTKPLDLASADSLSKRRNGLIPRGRSWQLLPSLRPLTNSRHRTNLV